MLQDFEENMYSGPQMSRPESGGSGVTRNRDGVPIWSGDQATFEEYVEACLMYEQTVVWEKRYLCGPRCASELRGAAKRILVGRPADWLSHPHGVRTLIAALREEKGYPKIPEMSELLMKYFKGTRRQRGESMHDFITRKAEAYTRAQQSTSRLQSSNDLRQGWNVPGPSSRGTSTREQQDRAEVTAGNSEEGTVDDDFGTPRASEEESQYWGRWQGHDWAWSAAAGWIQLPGIAGPRPHHQDSSELGRRDLPEILPNYVQGWFLFVDAGLDTMERNVLQAELRGDFSVKAVEDVLRKHWTDADLRRRDAEKGRQFGNILNEDLDEESAALVGEWDQDSLEAEGFSAEEISYLADEHERALQAYQVMQGAKRTLREARSKQHAVKMARQFYSVKSSTSGPRGEASMWKSMRSKDDSIKCFRCGGPHKVAECKEPPRRPAATGQGNVTTDEAPFVFLAESQQALVTQGHEVKGDLVCLTTREVMEQGKAIIDGGATRTIGSIEALSRVADLNQELRGTSGIKEVDLSDRPIFGFGNSSKDQCVSTASLEVPLDGKMSTLRVHALDKGSAPVLMSVHSLRKLGAIIDFENDLAVFRSVDPKKVIQLECTAAGHQVMPLADDVMKSARELKAPAQSLACLG